MFNDEITAALLSFTKLFINSPDTVLDRPWHWNGHNEGIRFAFFVVSRNLSDLTVRLETMLSTSSPVLRILSQYHSAYLDLQAVLYGLTPEVVNLTPSEKDWSVRRTYAHILSADIGFFATIQYALEGHRQNKWAPEPMSDEDEIRLIGMSEAQYQSLMSSNYETLLNYHQKLHSQIITGFSDITAVELDLPAAFWEPLMFPIRYRLHRYEAHMRQHTIQIEKTLTSIDIAPNETKLLIRLLFASLARIDGVLINTHDKNVELCQKTANNINIITDEIRTLF